VAAALEEKSIAPQALQNIEKLKADPVARSLISAVPEPDIELPAEAVLPPP
jgi:hypothetical protein